MNLKVNIDYTLPQRDIIFLSWGDKVANRLLTWICVGRSYLNAHSFKYQLSDSPLFPKCNLHSESTSHFVQICTAHNEARRTMLGVLEQFIPKFKTFSKQKKTRVFLKWFWKGQWLFFTTNNSLQYAVQKFIIQTKRFISFI